ncbi:MAG: DUF1990 domain-containing protein [bacterium]
MVLIFGMDMFLLGKPSAERIRRFIVSQCELPFSYPEVGATRRALPAEYTIDHNRVKLGIGAEVFKRAVRSLENWKQFDLGWVRIVPEGTPVKVDAVVAILTRHFGFWSLNACRVVYLVEENEPVKKFGFAYGTLSSHVERGEERFTVEWDADDDSVWYDILAFSRPNKILVRLGFPLARLLQKRFARDSLSAMSHLHS